MDVPSNAQRAPTRGAVRYEHVYALPALLRAFRRARRAKRGRGGELTFYFRLEAEILGLSDALRARTYTPDPYRYFRLRHAKERVVSEASFRDRVVHHSIVAALEPAFEPRFITHSYACRRGKGHHAALHRARHMAQRYRYALRLDVRRYFDSIRHDILLGLLRRRVADTGVLWLAATIMAHARLPHLPVGSEGCGLPIGNLTSQFWANAYLDPLDQRAVAGLALRTYTRYMDDVLLFADDKETLWDAAAELTAFARDKLALQMKPSATRVLPVTDGVPWLGFRVFPLLVRLDAPGRTRTIRRLRASARRASAGPAAADAEAERAGSVIAHASHANTYAWRQSLCGVWPSG